MGERGFVPVRAVDDMHQLMQQRPQHVLVGVERVRRIRWAQADAYLLTAVVVETEEAVALAGRVGGGGSMRRV